MRSETSEELFERVYSLNVKVPYFLVCLAGSFDGQASQRGHRQSLHNGGRLRGGWDGPLWVKQSCVQAADESPGG